jgi:hypothetical protein
VGNDVDLPGPEELRGGVGGRLPAWGNDGSAAARGWRQARGRRRTRAGAAAGSKGRERRGRGVDLSSKALIMKFFTFFLQLF